MYVTKFAISIFFLSVQFSAIKYIHNTVQLSQSSFHVAQLSR
jgi:hypothetical protein